MWPRNVRWLMMAVGCCLLAQDRPQTQAKYVCSSQTKAALGASFASQIRRQTTPLGLVRVDEYLQGLERKLASQFPDDTTNWSLAVVRDDPGGSTRAATGLPAGYLFVSAPLVLAAENEAELAGMLAHAMAHVAERHACVQAGSSQIASMATIPLFFTMGLAGENENSLVPSSLAKMSRELELEADRVAVQVMARAGFDPHALADYLGRVQAMRSPSVNSRSPLPTIPVRIGSLEQSLRDLNSPGFLGPVEPLQSLQAEIRQELKIVAASQEVRRTPSLQHPGR